MHTIGSLKLSSNNNTVSASMQAMTSQHLQQVTEPTYTPFTLATCNCTSSVSINHKYYQA